jgi:ADP-ribose pyrophosphatase YjhB (NUDIX family)
MKVRIAAVIVDQENILLIEHRRRGRVYWTLPGGGLEEGETIEACLRREVKEETGLDIMVLRPLFVADVISENSMAATHVVNLIFHAEVDGGQLASGHGGRADEMRDRAEWIPLASVPALGLYPPVIEEIAAVYRENFHGETKYLGNLWREIEAADRVGGTPAE